MDERESMLSIFPIDVLLLIKEQIPAIQLRNHVWFAQVCGPASGAVYNDAYWEGSFIRFGLGLLPDEDASTISWRRVVLDLIREDGFCEHPQCGTQRLVQNYRQMSRLPIKNFTLKALQDLMENGGQTSTCPFPNTFGTNPLFFNLDFSSRAYTDVRSDGFLRLRGHSRGQSFQSHSHLLFSPLHSHPIARRSFATFAPVSKLRLATLSGVPRVENRFGVTVWDVFAAIHSKLDTDDTATISTTCEFARSVDYHVGIKKNMVVAKPLLRDFFQTTRWDGLCYVGHDYAKVPRFALGFQTTRV